MTFILSKYYSDDPQAGLWANQKAVTKLLLKKPCFSDKQVILNCERKHNGKSTKKGEKGS
jgi:hypothetical protein